MKFTCTKCANCCITLGKGEGSANSGLPLFSWEYRRLSRFASENGIKADFAADIIVGETKLVAGWILKGPLCPFLREKECIIYEQRPIRCRAYPVEVRNIGGKVRFGSNICPSIPALYKKGFSSDKDTQSFMKDLYECFGEAMVAAWQEFLLQDKISSFAVKLKGYKSKEIVDIFDVLVENKIIAPKDYVRLQFDAETFTEARKSLREITEGSSQSS
jgi:Fe-S-cluster containining protein